MSNPNKRAWTVDEMVELADAYTRQSIMWSKDGFKEFILSAITPEPTKDCDCICHKANIYDKKGYECCSKAEPCPYETEPSPTEVPEEELWPWRKGSSEDNEMDRALYAMRKKAGQLNAIFNPPPEKECKHCDGRGYVAQIDKLENEPCDYCQSQPLPEIGELKARGKFRVTVHNDGEDNYGYVPTYGAYDAMHSKIEELVVTVNKLTQREQEGL